jgi:hypothetical protein
MAGRAIHASRRLQSRAAVSAWLARRNGPLPTALIEINIFTGNRCRGSCTSSEKAAESPRHPQRLRGEVMSRITDRPGGWFLLNHAVNRATAIRPTAGAGSPKPSGIKEPVMTTGQEETKALLRKAVERASFAPSVHIPNRGTL